MTVQTVMADMEIQISIRGQLEPIILQGSELGVNWQTPDNEILSAVNGALAGMGVATLDSGYKASRVAGGVAIARDAVYGQ